MEPPNPINSYKNKGLFDILFCFFLNIFKLNF